MKKFYNTILLIIIVLSCNDIDRPSKPKNLISEGKMVDIITDMSLLNAAKGVDRNILEENGIVPLNFIYEKYQIDSLQFAQSNNYYAYNVNKYEAIYSKVKERLEKEKVLINAQQEEKKKAKDSIRDARKARLDSLKNIKVKSREFKPSKEKNLKEID